MNANLAKTLNQQDMRPDSPTFGGWINPEHGLDEHGSAPSVLGSIWGVLWGWKAHHIPLPMDEDVLLKHAQAAAKYSLNHQNELGLFDLRSCNYSSSPDAAFAVHRLGLGMLLAQSYKAQLPAWQTVYTQCETFMELAVEGIKAGGFHTPNHRWVICGALSIAKQVIPELEVEETVQSYLAEGIDVDPDGAYTEHSTGVYDAICNLCLLLTAEFGHPEVLPAVKANLNYNLHMIDANGEAETGLSLRQDFGQRPVPLDLAAAYLYCSTFEASPDFVQMAKVIWAGKERPGTTDLLWLAFALNRQQIDTSNPEQLADFTKFFPHNRFWRMRKGSFSATAFSGTHNLLTLNNGQAHLKGVSISQSYFGVGRFCPETTEPDGEGVQLTSSGQGHALHRPGYDLPTGRKMGEFYSSREERDWRRLPPAHSTLSIQPVKDGLKLVYRTINNYPNVLVQVAFDFLPGGIWECEGGSFQPQAGQIIFLTAGFGRMYYGEDSLTIGPGSDVHRYWQMRDTPRTKDLVRVVIPLLTPVDHHFIIQSK
ncbi:MAG: hypothetical protein V2J07_09420 [Anaerolineae bacterium]|nr:hypothetical protein [Anaerolineae bacterium]